MQRSNTLSFAAAARVQISTLICIWNMLFAFLHLSE
jgi:hypothetical protein